MSSYKEKDEAAEIDLLELIADLIRYLIRFWWQMLIICVVGTSIMILISYQRYEAKYQSFATFTVSAGGTSAQQKYYSSTGTAGQLAESFPYILNSSYFSDVLRERMGKQAVNGNIQVAVTPKSNIVTMTATSNNPRDAYDVLQRAIEVYPDVALVVLGRIDFKMLEEPVISKSPVNRHSLLKNGIIGFLMSGMLVVCFLVVWSLTHHTVKNEDDIKKISTMKRMAHVPLVKEKQRKNSTQFSLSMYDNRTPANFVESIRSLQLRVQFAMDRRKSKVLMVTSTFSGEGKSTIAMNLAEAFANSGKKVLLVDADLRKMSLSNYLEESGEYNLKDLEAFSDEEIEKQIQSVESPLWKKIEKRKIYFFGNNKECEQPTGTYMATQMATFFKCARRQMDYIIIDTAPAGIFQDVDLLADYADELLYVVKYDALTVRKLSDTLSELPQKQVNIMGYVFNNYPERQNSYGYYDNYRRDSYRQAKDS